MSELKSNPSIIIVDREAGETDGPAEIGYSKEFFDELYERRTGTSWTFIDPNIRTGRGDEADRHGGYTITLRPGEFYEAGIFQEGHGPLTTDPVVIEKMKIFCILKKPEVRNLITDQNRSSGGTWHFHQIATNIKTEIVLIAVSQKPPGHDPIGIPQYSASDIEGSPANPLIVTQNHLVEIRPLLPGNHYFFVCVVVDEFGNWDVVEEQFDTLLRKMTVQFKNLQILNDGDSGGTGEAEFWFYVDEEKVIDEFHLPEDDISDKLASRNIPLGFAHIGVPQRVKQWDVKILARGTEYDGIFDSDEGAQSVWVNLPLPAGRFVESVTNSSFRLDCPTSTVGDDFTFGVDIIWSAEYVTGP